MDRETLKQIVIIETVMMILLSIICGMITITTLGKLSNKETELKNLQRDYNLVTTRRK